jgi:ubiquitin conjugation factor E4 B
LILIEKIFSISNSDQTDPFNRNPLRMQDVIPQGELKQTIEQWKASRRG